MVIITMTARKNLQYSCHGNTRRHEILQIHEYPFKGKKEEKRREKGTKRSRAVFSS